MGLDELTVKQKDINKKINSLLKERRILAERYKFEYDRYESIKYDDSDSVQRLKNTVDTMKYRAQSITKQIDAYNNDIRLLIIEMEKYK
jgi:chaperonin cofactor prefoldin